MYRLYYTEDALYHTDEAALLSVLDDARRSKIIGRTTKDRIASAAAAALLRYALCDTGNAVFCEADIVWDGKPHFTDPMTGLFFNLSHTVDGSRGIFAAAVLLSDEDEVGVDLEFVRPIRSRDALMRRLFTPDERDYVRNCGEECAFFDIWCAKEAFIKLTGEGFARRMSSISVDRNVGQMIGDGLVCDLRWMTVGQGRICCAADRLPDVLDVTEVSVGVLGRRAL